MTTRSLSKRELVSCLLRFNPFGGYHEGMRRELLEQTLIRYRQACGRKEH